MGYAIQKDQTAQPLQFLMVDSATKAAKTGLTPTVTISKNGASFAAPAGAVSEVGNGIYKVAGNATDSSALGPLLLYATASGADPSWECFPVVAYDPLEMLESNVKKVYGTALTEAKVPSFVAAGDCPDAESVLQMLSPLMKLRVTGNGQVLYGGELYPVAGDYRIKQDVVLGGYPVLFSDDGVTGLWVNGDGNWTLTHSGAMNGDGIAFVSNRMNLCDLLLADTTWTVGNGNTGTIDEIALILLAPTAAQTAAAVAAQTDIAGMITDHAKAGEAATAVTGLATEATAGAAKTAAEAVQAVMPATVVASKADLGLIDTTHCQLDSGDSTAMLVAAYLDQAISDPVTLPTTPPAGYGGSVITIGGTNINID